MPALKPALSSASHSFNLSGRRGNRSVSVAAELSLALDAAFVLCQQKFSCCRKSARRFSIFYFQKRSCAQKAILKQFLSAAHVLKPPKLFVHRSLTLNDRQKFDQPSITVVVRYKLAALFVNLPHRVLPSFYRHCSVDSCRHRFF